MVVFGDAIYANFFRFIFSSPKFFAAGTTFARTSVTKELSPSLVTLQEGPATGAPRELPDISRQNRAADTTLMFCFRI
jgi:hypothetical protein